jgi:hypothetical protein
MKHAIIALAFLATGCGQAPSLTTAGAVTSTVTTKAVVTCPSGTSNVQGTTCEETTPRTATTQLNAATFCANDERSLCSIAARVGQFASANQEQVGVKYWLSDFTGGEGFVIEDGQAAPTVLNSFPFFCCVTGSL